MKKREGKRGRQPALSVERAAAALTPEQVAAIVDQWTVSQFCDDDSIGDLLVVIRALVFRDDPAEREHRPAEESSALMWRDEYNQIPRLTVERARRLVGLILRSDEDEEARALIELMTGIAYDQDHGHRDGLALAATHEAYSMTSEFSSRGSLRDQSGIARERGGLARCLGNSIPTARTASGVGGR